MKRPPSLRVRIRNGGLAMLVVAMVFGALALPQVDKLGGAIRQTLYRNYLSIEASQHMQAALWQLELATHAGRAAAVLAPSRDEFRHWIAVEEGDITEVGEAALARDIDQRGQRLFEDLAREPGAATDRYDGRFAELHRLLDRLVEINRDAMFRADSRATRLGDRLTYELAAGLMVLLLLGIALAWTLAWNISKPLAELTERLRSFSLRGPSLRLGKQALAELDAVAAEFNRMAERLEQFEKLNVDRLLYEKNKTEAIIESIEDGIVLIDPDGVVTHINEVAAIILGVEPREALGSVFDDLNSSHPHYLRVRAALQSAARRPLESQRVEIDLYVRGREHSYVLKPVPLRQGDSASFGTILILQDVTYLRDKDRARANLVATLSHELKTPLTSLALSAELLEREKEKFEPRQRELLTTIVEDLARIRNLANDLLDLARAEAAAISMRTARVELGALLDAVVKTFRLQAGQKNVTLTEEAGPLPQIVADPVKLSWVVSNLIANALRYTPAGGSIAIAAEHADKVVRLKVRDSGPGVAPEVRDRLFERFAQWNLNGAEPGSAGLGLAIAREIVEAHGGRIFVESAPGQGTCFTVELPIRTEDRWAES
jgi:NtrC-family two-component system sensor histidine kinase KinB